MEHKYRLCVQYSRGTRGLFVAARFLKGALTYREKKEIERKMELARSSCPLSSAIGEKRRRHS